MKNRYFLPILIFFVQSISFRVSAAEPDLSLQHVEPGVAYGKAENLPLPKMLVFSVNPDEVIADAAEWAKMGYGGFFLDNVAGEWSTDIWSADGKPWTIGASDEMLQKCKHATEICKPLGMDNFLKMHFSHTLEWFNNTAWQRIESNFRQFAIFARDSGCTGIAIDIEYIGEQYSFDWPGYDYKGYTKKDLVEKIRARMTRVMSIMYDEFPDMIFLLLPEEGFNLGGVIEVAWVEEAARRNAPGGIHYCMESTYRSPNIRSMLGWAWADNQFFDRVLSEKVRKYWTEKCSLAEGVWPFGFDYQTAFDPGMSQEEFHQEIAGALMASRRYAWVFAHITKEQLVGRAKDKYKGPADIPAYLRVVSDRQIITTPKYLDLARWIREMKLEDYSDGLGLVPTVSFGGPAETPGLSLIARDRTNPADLKSGWDLALKFFAGGEVDLHEHYQTQTHWMLPGPFPSNAQFSGHKTAYPPEQQIDLNAEYDGAGGKIRWTEYQAKGALASVDLTKVFKPTELVSAYALCYVTSDTEHKVQLRIGTNDAGKVWFNGELVLDFPYEGTAFLDRDIIPVTIPKGKTPILLKITNKQFNWGFVFRITEADGRPAEGLELSSR